jgi:hypothetical protein
MPVWRGPGPRAGREGDPRSWPIRSSWRWPAALCRWGDGRGDDLPDPGDLAGHALSGPQDRDQRSRVRAAPLCSTDQAANQSDPDGDLKFGAFKVGSHDDLVTSLGLAVLIDPPGPQLTTF